MFYGRVKLVLVYLLSFVLWGCSDEVPAKSANFQDCYQQGSQQLPISAHTEIAGQIIELEIAKTPEQQAIGLMYRSCLPENRGMLFPFMLPRYVQFWMKNVEIPLDMIFLEKGTVRAVFANVPPCKADPCPVYGPSVPVDQVLELPGGRAKELGLKPGDRLNIQQ